MKDNLKKSDIIWSYGAKLLPMSTGLITLPIILHTLSETEIALNYVFMTITSLVTLFDMGFSIQFSRNFVSVFSGGQDILAEGFTKNVSQTINYRLLFLLIKSAKVVYFLLALILTTFLLTGGTWYIYDFTQGFTALNNSLCLWITYTISTVIDFYFKFYTPLLLGQGRIAEVSKISVYGQIIKVIAMLILLYLGFGLWSLVFSTLIVVIYSRVTSHHYFYTQQMKKNLLGFKAKVSEIKDICKTLWYNAKQQSIIRVCSFAATQLGIFYTGLFLVKQDVAGYGLLMQLVGIISTLANILNYSYTPLFSSLRIKGENEKLYKYLCISLGSCYIFYLIGGLFLFLVIPLLLDLIKSNATLPVFSISFIYFLCRLLQDQHCICSMFLSTKNYVYDLQSSSIIGFANAFGLYFILKYTDLKLLGVVLVQFIIALCYPDWKWPWEVCKDMNVSYFKLLKDSMGIFISICIDQVKNIIIKKV